MYNSLRNIQIEEPIKHIGTTLETTNIPLSKLYQNAGLDMNNIRRSIVEETIARAIPKIINEGDLDKLTQLAQMAGEKPDVDIPDGAKRITRERITVEID